MFTKANLMSEECRAKATRNILAGDRGLHGFRHNPLALELNAV